MYLQTEIRSIFTNEPKSGKHGNNFEPPRHGETPRGTCDRFGGRVCPRSAVAEHCQAVGTVIA